jgi:hypothetical protein
MLTNFLLRTEDISQLLQLPQFLRLFLSTLGKVLICLIHTTIFKVPSKIDYSTSLNLRKFAMLLIDERIEIEMWTDDQTEIERVDETTDQAIERTLDLVKMIAIVVEMTAIEMTEIAKKIADVDAAIVAALLRVKDEMTAVAVVSSLKYFS